MTELKKLTKMFKTLGVAYSTVDKNEFLREDAKKKGAVMCVCLMGGQVDIYFDKKGRHVGVGDTSWGKKGFIKRCTK